MDQPNALLLLRISYHVFLLKIVELIETVFFVMRKKYKQISKLHVYHHASTVSMGYLMVKYVGGSFKLYIIVVLILNVLYIGLFCASRWYDLIFGCAELVCAHNNVQLLFCRSIRTQSTEKIGANQKTNHPIPNGIIFKYLWCLYFNICYCFQIQFTLILMQCTLSLYNQCGVPKLLLAVYIPNVAIIFYMFYDFFKSAYNKNKTNVEEKND